MATKRAIFITTTSNKTFDQVMAEKNAGFAYCNSLGYSAMDALFTEEVFTEKRMEERGVVNRNLFLFAKTLDRMSMCSAVHFSDDCKDDPTAAKLREIAEKFSVEII